MTPGNEAKVLELLESVAQTERLMRTSPNALKKGFGIALKYLNEQIDAIEDGGAEGWAEAERVRKSAPSYARHVLDIHGYVFVVERGTRKPLSELVGTPDEVWVRWDTVPLDLRAATASLASIVVDAVTGKRAVGGRGRKKTL